jgi:zinc transporter ZupT
LDWFIFLEELSEHIEKFHVQLLSLGGGLIVATFFLEMLPQIESGRTFLGEYTYIALLIGFVLVHFVEKIVYRYAGNEEEVQVDTAKFEAIGLTIYNLCVGFIIAVFSEVYGESVLLIFTSFIVRAFVISVSSSHINEVVGRNLNRFLQLVAPLGGVLFAFILTAYKIHFFLTLSVVIGAILYVVVRDMIPRGKEGKPIYFLLGVLIIIGTFLVLEALAGDLVF